MFDSYSDLMGIKEACELLQISRPTLINILNSGKLQGCKVGKKVWRIPKKNIEKYIAESCTNANIE